MSIPVNKIVNVAISTSPTFPARKGFGLLNIVGVSNVIPEVERYRIYSDMDGVADDFASTDDEYAAAQVFFSQSPRPAELMISRRINTAGGTSGRRIGSTDHFDLSTSQDMPPNTLAVTIDGVVYTTAALSFGAAGSFADIATIVQNALVAAGAVGATCVYLTDHYEIRSGTTGVTSTVTLAGAQDTAGNQPAEVMGLLTSQGGISVAGTGGAGLEDMNACLDAIESLTGAWYGLAHAPTDITDADVKAAAAWVEARVKVHAYNEASADALNPANTTNLGYFFKAGGYHRSFGTYHPDDGAYPQISAFARAFTVDFNGTNTTITLKFKQLPTVPYVNITESQRQALLGFNLNYYTQFGESAMLAEGVMADGTFFDEVHGLDWLQNALENNVFGYLYTRTTKVPQTDKGVAALVQQCDKAMQEAVRNGLCAPGVWNGGDLGEVSTGDLLPKGYYIYAQPVAEQSQANREGRKAPPIQIIAKGGGAIHFADIALTFER